MKSQLTLKEATLILADGSKFHGYSFGGEKPAAGEVVFNTGMTGYPESLTDPSYFGQILVMTYPLQGNYGVPLGEYDRFGLTRRFESERIQIAALVVSEHSSTTASRDDRLTLERWLSEAFVPGIYGVDTRELTKKLREDGTMLGKIVFDQDIPFFDPNQANHGDEVSITTPKIYGGDGPLVILVDCGVKLSIIRELLRCKLKIMRVPWNYDFTKEAYRGVLISNGPGNPVTFAATIANVRKILGDDRPIMGICLGNQILGLAAGANTYKLKYGHRSQNQPCLRQGGHKAFMTSQNHGFALEDESLPSDWYQSFFNVNDRTNEGINHRTKPFFGVQFHPEANPGPTDTRFLFDEFAELVKI